MIQPVAIRDNWKCTLFLFLVFVVLDSVEDAQRKSLTELRVNVLVVIIQENSTDAYIHKLVYFGSKV